MLLCTHDLSTGPFSPADLVLLYTPDWSDSSTQLYSSVCKELLIRNIAALLSFYRGWRLVPLSSYLFSGLNYSLKVLFSINEKMITG